MFQSVERVRRHFCDEDPEPWIITVEKLHSVAGLPQSMRVASALTSFLRPAHSEPAASFALPTFVDTTSRDLSCEVRATKFQLPLARQKTANRNCQQN
jgi:hypothetical protein